MKPYDCMYLISKDQYESLERNARAAVDGVGGDVQESQFNKIDVSNGGTVIIREAKSETAENQKRELLGEEEEGVVGSITKGGGKEAAILRKLKEKFGKGEEEESFVKNNKRRGGEFGAAHYGGESTIDHEAIWDKYGYGAKSSKLSKANKNANAIQLPSSSSHMQNRQNLLRDTLLRAHETNERMSHADDIDMESILSEKPPQLEDVEMKDLTPPKEKKMLLEKLVENRLNHLQGKTFKKKEIDREKERQIVHDLRESNRLVRKREAEDKFPATNKRTRADVLEGLPTQGKPKPKGWQVIRKDRRKGRNQEQVEPKSMEIDEEEEGEEADQLLDKDSGYPPSEMEERPTQETSLNRGLKRRFEKEMSRPIKLSKIDPPRGVKRRFENTHTDRSSKTVVLEPPRGVKRSHENTHTDRSSKTVVLDPPRGVKRRFANTHNDRPSKTVLLEPPHGVKRSGVFKTPSSKRIRLEPRTTVKQRQEDLEELASQYILDTKRQMLHPPRPGSRILKKRRAEEDVDDFLTAIDGGEAGNKRRLEDIVTSTSRKVVKRPFSEVSEGEEEDAFAYQPRKKIPNTRNKAVRAVGIYARKKRKRELESEDEEQLSGIPYKSRMVQNNYNNDDIEDYEDESS